MNGIEYKVPSMKEIAQISPNGYNVVSTFSGGGGSCLGYRMAGYKVLYANEFIEEARNTYRANNPLTYLDGRDIRTVTPESILQIIGMKKGEIDLFDGSPPCCAFSTCGKREKGWNKHHKYSDSEQSNIEDLFYEYIRILKGLMPKVFVAENVSGLIKGTAIGYFNIYLEEMKKAGYNVKAGVLNAKYLGVPQSRERVIFIGVRNDLNLSPIYPKPNKHIVTIADAFKNLPQGNISEAEELCEQSKSYKWCKILKYIPKNPAKRIQGSSIMNGSWFNLVRESYYQPCGTICQMNGAILACGNCHPVEDRKFTIPELKRITSIPDDFVLTGNSAQQWERLGRMVPPLMMKSISETIRKEILDKCETKC